MALTADQMLAEDMKRFYADPLGYVMYNFPWKTDPSIQQVPLVEPWRSRYDTEYGPDQWACEFLDELGEEIKKRRFTGRGSVDPIRFTTSSGHGIGKSTLVAWLILFILDTRPKSMGVVTANTSDQLRTKTWAELAKWHHLALTSHFWDYMNSRGNMSLSRRGRKDIKQKWRCDAMTARAENAEAFQGLHAAESTPFYIFDEASGIDDEIWAARIGGATDGEPMSFDFGNPTRKSGYFYENCVGSRRHRYIVRQIDSRDVHITNKSYFEELRQDYGEDSDMFKVKCRGIFPAVGSVQFISTDWVRDAQTRPGVHDKNDPLLIGCDIARFGDNNTVIFPRLGMDAKSFPFRQFNGLDTVQVVEQIVEIIQEFKRIGKQVSGLFVDGGGLGAGPVDMLRRLGYNPIDVNFGGGAADRKYRYKGDEMWGRMRDAMPRLALPNDPELRDQLTQREYGITNAGRINLESKKDMKERGVESPDIADALALTWATEVSSEITAIFNQEPLVAYTDYDPLDDKYV